jgi:MFS family permease
MFFGTFAWSFVYVSLPFHIQAISHVDPPATLRWAGWILGASPLTTVVTAPLWGRWAERGDPKKWYVVIEALQGLTFFGMALARTLPELFLVRLVLGLMGAASTFAFIMAGRAGSPAAVRREVAAVQSAMTVGQVIGPLVGALAAARLGFRTSFVLGGVILLACSGVVGWAVPGVPPGGRPRELKGPAGPGEVGAVALSVLGGNVQVFFLPAILPQLLPDLGVEPARTLELGGVLLFVSGVAAALGSLAAPRMAELRRPRRLLPALLAISSVLIAALALLESVWAYACVRFLQVLAIAPVFPIVVAHLVQRAGGEAIGVVNSARIGAAFVAPVLATSVMARWPAGVLYGLLAAVGLLCVPLATLRSPRRSMP